MGQRGNRLGWSLDVAEGCLKDCLVECYPWAFFSLNRFSWSILGTLVPHRDIFPQRCTHFIYLWPCSSRIQLNHGSSLHNHFMSPNTAHTLCQSVSIPATKAVLNNPLFLLWSMHRVAWFSLCPTVSPCLLHHGVMSWVVLSAQPEPHQRK